MAFNPYYTGYNPYPNYQYYQQPPAMDNLAQLRQAQMNPQMMQQPVQGQTANQNMGQPMQPPPINGIIWVQGEEGAKSYLVAPGNTVFLMDSEREVFYMKTVDANGIPLPLRVFDYTERQQGANGVAKQNAQATPPAIDLSGYVLRDEFDALATKFDYLTMKLDSIATTTRQSPKTVKAKKEDVENGESAV